MGITRDNTGTIRGTIPNWPNTKYGDNSPIVPAIVPGQWWPNGPLGPVWIANACSCILEQCSVYNAAHTLDSVRLESIDDLSKECMLSK
jgi:hypothetical protein